MRVMPETHLMAGFESEQHSAGRHAPVSTIIRVRVLLTDWEGRWLSSASGSPPRGCSTGSAPSCTWQVSAPAIQHQPSSISSLLGHLAKKERCCFVPGVLTGSCWSRAAHLSTWQHTPQKDSNFCPMTWGGPPLRQTRVGFVCIFSVAPRVPFASPCVSQCCAQVSFADLRPCSCRGM